MSFCENILSFIEENWSAALVFLGTTTVELAVWGVKTWHADRKAAELQSKMDEADRKLESYKAELDRQGRAIDAALDMRSHVRVLSAERMVEGVEALCARANELCNMAMPCVAVDMCLESGERHGDALKRTLGWDEVAAARFNGNLTDLIGKDDLEKWQPFVSPEIWLFYSCMVAYARRCLLILDHGIRTGDECDFAHDEDLNKIASEWAGLEPAGGHAQLNQGTRNVRETLDVLKGKLLNEVRKVLTGEDEADAALRTYGRIESMIG